MPLDTYEKTGSEGDWYDDDPCTDVESNPEWYAPDLIEGILESKVNHEISTHTFTHIDFSDENCTRELALSELRKCREVMKEFGLTPRTIVFPGGTAGHYSELKEMGIIGYRGKFTGKEELVFPQISEHGIVNLPASLGLGKREEWSNAYQIKRIKKYIDAAIKNKLLFHLYFHPSLNSELVEEIFPAILAYGAKKRDEGKLWIATMEEIAANTIQ